MDVSDHKRYIKEIEDANAQLGLDYIPALH